MDFKKDFHNQSHSNDSIALQNRRPFDEETKVLADITNAQKNDSISPDLNTKLTDHATSEARKGTTNLVQSEDAMKSKKRKTSISQKTPDSSDVVQTLKNCYRDKKIIRIKRRKVCTNASSQDVSESGSRIENEGELSATPRDISEVTSGRIKIRYPKILSPRPNVKTILKYTF
eukprot:jgi/Galph1/4021/GphlegSOOS_G2708.1